MAVPHRLTQNSVQPPFCILPSARGLSAGAQHRRCTTGAGQKLARSFQQESILALPGCRTGTVPLGDPNRKISREKSLREITRYFERRDYRHTPPADQGGLEGSANAATGYLPTRSNASGRNPNCRRRLLSPILARLRGRRETKSSWGGGGFQDPQRDNAAPRVVHHGGTEDTETE